MSSDVKADITSSLEYDPGPLPVIVEPEPPRQPSLTELLYAVQTMTERLGDTRVDAAVEAMGNGLSTPEYRRLAAARHRRRMALDRLVTALRHRLWHLEVGP
ncbi:MAG: hypothetical protein ACRDT2_03345 [Natronosporangium sp.]